MSSETKASKITVILGGARSGKSGLAEQLAHRRATTANGVLYIATLAPGDDEMRQRISRHRAGRPATWRTLETPYELADPVLERLQQEQVVLLDCLTVWTSNRLLREDTALPATSGPVYEEPGEPGTAVAAGSSSLEPDREETITSDLQADLPVRRPTTNPETPTPPDYTRLEAELMRELEALITGLRQRNTGLIIVTNEVGLGLVPPYPLGRVYRDMLGRINQRVAALADEVFMVFAGLPIELKRLQATLE